MAVSASEDAPSPATADLKERIIRGLAQGKAMAKQLQVLLPHLGSSGSDVLVARELTANILGSFTASLSELGSHRVSPRDRTRSPKPRPRRGCYKRRKSSQTRTVVASTAVDDVSWRKYGQKQIHNSKFPRSYYRCSHKYDRHCKAIKQVQMMEESPPLYEITYIDSHTCTSDGKADPTPQQGSSSGPLMETRPPHALAEAEADNLDMKEENITVTLDMKEDIITGSSSVTALQAKEEAKEDTESDVTGMEINSLLMEAGDFHAESSLYPGFGMDFLVADDDCVNSMFYC
ncbi:hypothetical protein MLD38_009713 [Melastoma candidum]|uniref:Uncharacterized protein n=1 Tax=Melastoma candidum TaxID=119954 RepID=A0ACB9RYM3_9MYRT|nr:hypothetical protein MLD38_009713 [Melastoma candidum]